jgi:CDP-glucose 4,6-dehydratase
MINSFWKNRKVFITGHTGFKGAWLCIWLKNMGAEVTGYSIDTPTVPALFEICNVENNMNSFTGDIKDTELIYKTMKSAQPQVVFHLAAQSLVRESYKNPSYTYGTNVMGTVNLFEAIRRCDSVRVVINVTTDKCYLNKESIWGYRENDRLGGYDPYSCSKACSELITESYVNSFFNPENYDRHGVAIATARAGNVIGGGDFSVDRLVPDCVRAAIKNEKVIIRNPYAVRPWQHVLEPLGGYINLAERLYMEGVKYNGAWNFGPNEDNEKNVQYIVNKLCSLWGSKACYELERELNPHETCYLRLDSSKARQLLGFKMKWNIDKALNEVVSWTKEFLSNESNIYNVCLSQIKEYERDD